MGTTVVRPTGAVTCDFDSETYTEHMSRWQSRLPPLATLVPFEAAYRHGNFTRAAHELHRPRAGGGSSFYQSLGGLRALVEAGCEPDAMMVISPQTVSFVYASVSWLWTEGVRRVRANVVLDAPWFAEDRAELGDELAVVELASGQAADHCGPEQGHRFVVLQLWGHLGHG